MAVVQVFSWIGRIAGTLALLLGLSVWIFSLDGVVGIHMLLGILVALSLLVVSVMALTRGLVGPGIGGIIYAIIVPGFGMSQQTILATDFHWIVQVVHLAVGVGAIGLVQALSTRYAQAKSGVVAA